MKQKRRTGSFASRYGTLSFTLTCAAWALVLFYGAAHDYVRQDAPLLHRLYSSVGETLLKEALHQEEAGLGASAAYEKALSARFAGTQNRASAERHLGALWAEAGRDAEAEALFKAAAGSPRPPISVYADLCALLLRLGRPEELIPYAEAWAKQGEAAGNLPAQAEARFYLGQAALAQGSAAQAEALFLEGYALRKGGLNAGALALLQSQRGNRAEAQSYAEEYLLSGAPGPERAAIWELWTRLAANHQ